MKLQLIILERTNIPIQSLYTISFLQLVKKIQPYGLSEHPAPKVWQGYRSLAPVDRVDILSTGVPVRGREKSQTWPKLKHI